MSKNGHVPSVISKKEHINTVNSNGPSPGFCGTPLVDIRDSLFTRRQTEIIHVSKASPFLKIDVS